MRLRKELDQSPARSSWRGRWREMETTGEILDERHYARCLRRVLQTAEDFKNERTMRECY